MLLHAVDTTMTPRFLKPDPICANDVAVYNHSAMNIPAFLSQRFVLTIEAGGERRKIFQILFNHRDGSLFVAFPYYKCPTGLLSLLSLQAGQTYPTSLSLREQGKATSHRVKYTHHPDGNCHFSQDGKIFTRIRKHSVPLSEANGHLFTVQLQGLADFKVLSPPERKPLLTPAKAIINWKFLNEASLAYKFVGNWYKVRDLSRMISAVGDKPWLRVERRDGSKAWGSLLSAPSGPTKDRYALLLTCEPIPCLDADRYSTLTFVGGFDPAKIALDHQKDTSFLALAYPTENYAELVQQIGSVDLAEPEIS